MIATGRMVRILIISCTVLSLVFEGCKEEEEVSCSSIEFQLQNTNRDLLQAALDGDCNGVSRLFSKIFSLLRQGKNCDYVINMVADEGYADVESYINYLEEERDRVLDALSC